ncbi:putative transmembrane protein [Hirsutella rhossiliensis]|uniref:Transmembrane protein n=1 Tax=Hirsutella rhossiliensis TaxID=111463 RepID=A0A9P8SH92_9HYPO|nr:putative transmembrane protein [Hirsutella rhossiliensis]KAH0961924.1 putative transmembrane protein [Hirsutella rhossiliensis]
MTLRKLCSLRPVVLAAVVAGLASALGLGRDAKAQLSGWDAEVEEPGLVCRMAEGQNPTDKYTGPREAFPGSEFVSLRIGHGPRAEALGVYRSTGRASRQTRHAYIIVHGKDRDAARYWERMRRGIERARQRGFPGAGAEAGAASLVLAPLFFSAVQTPGQYRRRELAWCGKELEGWQGGAQAAHPPGTRLTAFDALDGLLAHLADRRIYPHLTNVTLTGHSAGAQLVQRYAAVGRDPPPHLYVRYIHASESKYAYFTADRPRLAGHALPSKAACQRYDAWPYGFERLPHTRGGIDKQSAQHYFRQYATRDVVSIVGYRDVKNHGDQTCMARIQGGHARRSRSLVWYRYVNSLARTGEDLTGFPGRFVDLPDWSYLTNGTVSLRIVVIKSIGHSSRFLLRSKAARPALFGNGTFASPSWRPEEPDKKKRKEKEEGEDKREASDPDWDSDSDSDSDSDWDSDDDDD